MMIRPENKRMQDWLAGHGIKARASWIRTGYLRRTWHLYRTNTAWSPDLANKLNLLGFRHYNNRPLTEADGFRGTFDVFVRGHEELADDQAVTDPKTGCALLEATLNEIRNIVSEVADAVYKIRTALDRLPEVGLGNSESQKESQP